MKKVLKRIGIVLLVIFVIAAAAFGAYKIHEVRRVRRIMAAHEIEQPFAQDNSSDSEIITGVQQIMIGTLCDNYEDALQTLRNIKAAGYDGIELNDFMIHDTGLMVKLMTQFAGMPVGNGGKLDWPALIKESGLKVTSLHSDLGSIENDAKAVAAEAKSFGTTYVGITGVYNFDFSSLAEVEGLAQRLNQAGKALAAEGVQLLYHNHNCELQKVEDGRTAYEVILEETDPNYVNFEFDSYWMTDGGANVPALMEKLGPRLKFWHINDRGCTDKGPYMTPILTEGGTELGSGNMDLETLASIAKKNGVKGVIVETHQNWVNDDPIQSFWASADFMKKHF